MKNRKWNRLLAALLGGVMLGTTAGGSVYASSDVSGISKEDEIKMDFIEHLKEESPNDPTYDDLTCENVNLFKFYKLSEERILFSAKYGAWGSTSISDIKIGYHTFRFFGSGDNPAGFLYWENGTVDYVIRAYEDGRLSKEEIDAYYNARGGYPGIQSVRYKDVNWLEDWYADYAYTASRDKLMTGLNETTFGPYELVSRAQMVTILDRMDSANTVIFDEPFADVGDADWYFNSVVWAYQNGIIKGYDENTFGPTDSITREHLAVMLYRYAKYQGYDLSSVQELDSYSDANAVSECAAVPMKWCVANGIITGKQGCLDPQGTATRAECAAMVLRFIETFSPDKEVKAITGEEIAAYADLFVGNPYVWGGDSLTNGIDCSHFVYRILKNCGVYDGNYATTAVWRTKGEPVATLEEAQAGDVICYAGHVSIYDGKGGIIEAKGSEWGITHDRSVTFSTIYAIRRFV